MTAATTALPPLPLSLNTARLRLRPFVAGDASRLAMFVGDYDVAKMTAAIPHPYSEADAAEFIAGGGERHRYAIVHANGLIGSCGLRERDPGTLEIGYWLAKPFWGRGLMTEAARAVVGAARAADPDLILTSGHFVDNPASGRVLAKLGFVPDGEATTRCHARNAEVRTVRLSLPPVSSPRQGSLP